MITQLFIPEQVRGYYLFPVKIVGIDAGKTSIKATLISCKAKEITIEKFFETPIPPYSNPTEYTQHAAAVLKIILDQAAPYNHIISALPSSQAIFKELKLPFLGPETIKKVIGYEVEPLLPFSLQDAVIDCIVTKENKEEKSSEVLVAAVQNQYMAQHLALFEAAGAQPEKVTIDLFALYGLYSIIPAYSAQKGGTVLLEIEPQATRMAYIYDGQLRSIRTLPKGLLDQARLVAQKMGTTEQETLEHMIRFGLEADHDDAFIATLKQTFTTFFNDILFTLQSFVAQAKPPQLISKIILFGASASIKGLAQLVSDLSHIKTEIFQIGGLIHNGFGINAKTAVPQQNLVSLAAALPRSKTYAFNLRKKEFAPSEHAAFIKELITASSLLLFILGALIGNTIWQTVKLRREAYQSEQETIDAIKEHIKKIPDEANTLDEVLDAAKIQLNQEEKIWSAFSGAARSQFLEYLLELSSKINKANLGLDVEKLSILPDTIILKASVRDFEALTTLENDLNQSKLFKVEPVHDPKNFTMTIHIVKTTARRGRP